MDVLTPEQRRLNMSRIRSRNTTPELMLRRGLHADGFRYKLHARDLPGSPDLVFPRYRAVIFVHGCFWHGHDCPRFKAPSTRREFWFKKIGGNQLRDKRTQQALLERGWRVAVVWECALKGTGRRPTTDVVRWCRNFLTGSTPVAETGFRPAGARQ
ncbi:very short patch repair endonuclease [Lysobacter antibioticus]|uniref:very short patch repair endonuclease n=1 Tax=Lysobacter antibioticus TaxID=84531 RepID=UPI00094ED6FE|nr:very short patch repair endonuclease [Lysobacter antibioticus]